jgi:hypothetical protein
MNEAPWRLRDYLSVVVIVTRFVYILFISLKIDCQIISRLNHVDAKAIPRISLVLIHNYVYDM